ncbi:MAG TPA: TonB-dependent receptor [Bacteroidales bacterium]|nr:TonB-dependent receptor [Bacteroidales bacterium]
MNLVSFFRRVFVTSFLAATCLFAFAQEQMVSGVVKDAAGEPLIGVNVATGDRGTVTDLNGAYSLSVAADGQLVFSYIGYLSQTIAINGRSVINVTMEEDVRELEAVVKIGYGTVRKRDLTGAVASIPGKEIATIPVANAAQALQGKLPGVNVVSQDGRPDASISIRVRGGGSISQSNEPLYVVDGFPVSSISDIPAEQIESIDVLKDASSTAIYGARGANGVIIVTTKSAKEGKTSITYSGYAQSKVPTKYFETLGAYDYVAYNWAYADAIGAAYRDAWEMLWAIGPYAATYGNTPGIDYYKNVVAQNYQRQVYGESFSHSHNLNITGGNDKTNFLVAFNHIDDDGLKVNSWYKRTNASIKLDHKLYKKLTLSLDTRFTHTNSVGNESTTNTRGSVLSSSYFFRPIVTQHVMGELDPMVNSSLGMYDELLQDEFNPVARIKDYTPERNNRSLRANTALNWEIVKGLVARTELGLNTYWNKNHTWTGAIFNDYYDANGNKTYSGNASISRSEGWNMRWANVLSYEIRDLGEAHHVGVTLGQEIMDSNSESMSISGSRYPASYTPERAFAMMDQYDPGNLAYHSLSGSIGTPSRLMSYFARANYGLLDRYLLTVTFRADGSSRFAPTNRWGYFPAGAIAWRASEENFIKEQDWVDNLKLRFSLGSVGNDGISADLWKMNWTTGGLANYSINEERQVIYQPGSDVMANPNLKWETTITRDLGLDFGFLDNRVFGSLDLYYNTTKDLLMLTPISDITGFSFTYDNVGSTSNRGIEVLLGGDIIKTNDFNLTASLNVNINRGRVEELAEGIDGLYKTEWGSTMTRPNTGDYILEEGQPVGMVRGYTYEGWYTTSDFDYDPVTGIYTLKDGVPDIAAGVIGTVYGTENNKPGSQTAYPGVIKYADISGPDGVPDGVVDESDVVIIGNMNPKHTGGLNLNASYKSFDLGLFFNWSYGNQIYNANYLATIYGSKNDGLYRNRMDYLAGAYKIYDIKNGNLVKVTDPAALDALNTDASLFLPYHENAVVSTLGIEDGSFLRLNTATLGYTMPKNMIRKIGLVNARLYASVYNLFTLTKYSGLDPEVNTNTSQGGARYPTTGLDWGAYPRARSFTFGVNLEF